jgi:hypothetical protein
MLSQRTLNMNQCSYKDLIITGKGTYEYSVTEDFDYGDHISDTGMEEIESVDCNNCGEYFDDLDEAREHIEGPDAEDNDTSEIS